MKKNCIFYFENSKIQEVNFLQVFNKIENRPNLKAITISNTNAIALIEDNIYQCDFIHHPQQNKRIFISQPKLLNYFAKIKIKKIISNNSVVHSISEEGKIFSWGNDLSHSGVLALGNNFQTDQPTFNFFFTSQIIDISLSQKHGGAIDSNNKLWTWGTGKFGELGQGRTHTIFIPKIKETGIEISKVRCGETYTAFSNAEGRLFYIGKIDCSNKNLSKDDCKEILFIENLSFSDFCCGFNLISLIDYYGIVYLYNENEGLNKILLDRPIANIKSLDNSILALSQDREFLYKLTYFGNPSKQEFYEITTFLIEEDYRDNLSIIDTPNNSNLIFFNSEIENSQIKSREKNKIFSLFNRNFDIFKNKKCYVIPTESQLKKKYNKISSLISPPNVITRSFNNHPNEKVHTRNATSPNNSCYTTFYNLTNNFDTRSLNTGIKSLKPNSSSKLINFSSAFSRNSSHEKITFSNFQRNFSEKKQTQLNECSSNKFLHLKENSDTFSILNTENVYTNKNFYEILNTKCTKAEDDKVDNPINLNILPSRSTSNLCQNELDCKSELNLKFMESEGVCLNSFVQTKNSSLHMMKDDYNRDISKIESPILTSPNYNPSPLTGRSMTPSENDAPSKNVIYSKKIIKNNVRRPCFKKIEQQNNSCSPQKSKEVNKAVLLNKHFTFKDKLVTQVVNSYCFGENKENSQTNQTNEKNVYVKSAKSEHIKESFQKNKLDVFTRNVIQEGNHDFFDCSNISFENNQAPKQLEEEIIEIKDINTILPEVLPEKEKETECKLGAREIDNNNISDNKVSDDQCESSERKNIEKMSVRELSTENNEINVIDIRSKLIKDLETIKMENVKEKIQYLVTKYRNEMDFIEILTLISPLFLNQDEEKSYKFEPFELEKSIATLRSINYSLGEEKCRISQEEMNRKFKTENYENIKNTNIQTDRKELEKEKNTVTISQINEEIKTKKIISDSVLKDSCITLKDTPTISTRIQLNQLSTNINKSSNKLVKSNYHGELISKNNVDDNNYPGNVKSQQLGVCKVFNYENEAKMISNKPKDKLVSGSESSIKKASLNNLHSRNVSQPIKINNVTTCEINNKKPLSNRQTSKPQKITKSQFNTNNSSSLNINQSCAFKKSLSSFSEKMSSPATHKSPEKTPDNKSNQQSSKKTTIDILTKNRLNKVLSPNERKQLFNNNLRKNASQNIIKK